MAYYGLGEIPGGNPAAEAWEAGRAEVLYASFRQLDINNYGKAIPIIWKVPKLYAHSPAAYNWGYNSAFFGSLVTTNPYSGAPVYIKMVKDYSMYPEVRQIVQASFDSGESSFSKQRGSSTYLSPAEKAKLLNTIQPTDAPYPIAPGVPLGGGAVTVVNRMGTDSLETVMHAPVVGATASPYSTTIAKTDLTAPAPIVAPKVVASTPAGVTTSQAVDPETGLSPPVLTSQGMFGNSVVKYAAVGLAVGALYLLLRK